MNKRAAATLVAAVLLAAVPALAQQGSPPPAAAAAPAAAGMLPVSHLVYRFGYNTKATDQGPGTGNTTIDIVGPANDGGITVTATDDWWNTTKPRQSYTCEVYANGGVTCPQPPYAVSPIQITILPMLGQSFFAALSAPTSNWKQNYSVKATFFPAAATGFAGQVYTWNCAYTLTGKGTLPDQPPLVVIHFEGSMKQQGGRAITVNQVANMAFDPRIKVPVFLDEAITFVPRLSVNQYTVQMRLTATK